MPIMTRRTRQIDEPPVYLYVPVSRVDHAITTGWTTYIREPIAMDIRERYECMTIEPPDSHAAYLLAEARAVATRAALSPDGEDPNNRATEALADWERELLDPSDPSVSPVPIPPGSVPTPVTVEPEAETGDDEPDDEDDDNTFECEWCHSTTDLSDRYEIGSPRYRVSICHSCYQDARECDNCGRPIDTRNDNYDTVGEWDPTFFCSGCAHYSHWCDNCDSSYDGRYYDGCPNDDCISVSLHNYSHKPMPEFYIVDRDGKPTIVRANALHTTRRELVSVPFMGFELEMERNGCGTRIDTIVGRVYDMWGDFAYCKHDGSLNDGLELVTHPFTLEYAHEHINWDLLDSIRRDGYRSWNTTTAGMHVHVNRATFTGTAHLFRFAQLIYKNEPTCTSFAGRTSSYATFHDGYQKGYLANVVKGRVHGSRGAVNMQNTDTVEVRIFKGSLRYQRVLANLEFVHACVEYTRQLTVPDVVRGGLAWRTFATWILDNRSTYPHLFEYLDLNPTNPNHTNEPALATY